MDQRLEGIRAQAERLDTLMDAVDDQRAVLQRSIKEAAVDIPLTEIVSVTGWSRATVTKYARRKG